MIVLRRKKTPLPAIFYWRRISSFSTFILYLVSSFSIFYHEARERSESFFPWFPKEKKPLHNGSYEHRVPKIKNNTFFCTRYVCVIQHPLPSTALNAHGTNCNADGFYARTHINEPYLCYCVVCPSKLAEADAETCVFTGPVTQAGPRFAIFKNSKK